MKVLLAILALGICTGTLQATATLVANPTTLTLNCDTSTGPVSGTVGITLYASGSALNVTVTASTGLASPSGPVVMPGTVQHSVGSTSAAVNYTFTMQAGCAGTVPSGTTQLTFTPYTSTGTATGTALNVPVVLNITHTTSALSPSVSSLNFTCNTTASSVSPSGAQTINVTSAATGGTPFTIASSGANTVPGWLQLSSTAGGTAGSTAISFTATGVYSGSGGCGSLTAGTYTYNITLLNAPAPSVPITVTMVVGAASSLSASVKPVAMTYTAGTTNYNMGGHPATSNITNTPSSTVVFFQVDPTTVPSWLSVSPTSGTTPQALTFTAAAAGVKALFPGNYTATLHLKVSGDLDYTLTVNLQVNSAASTLSLQQGAGQTIATTTNGQSQTVVTGSQTVTWTVGTYPLPTVTITPVSSDAPIPFTVSFTTDNLGASSGLNGNTGLAYSFGSPFTVSFSASDFAALAPGNSTTEVVTITPGGSSTQPAVVFTITLKVTPQNANISSASPSVLPTATSGTSFTVSLNGTGFVTGNSSGTVVGVVTGTPNVLIVDSNITAVVQGSNSIVVTITVPSTNDSYLPFSGNGGTLTLGVCNPQTGSNICSLPQSQVGITIGTNPIISAVTSASSYIQATAPTLPTVAPYDILALFGYNFCVAGGTGCTSPNPTVMYGVPSAPVYTYPAQLSPDSVRNLTVNFYKHNSATLIAPAPLLFASNQQINLVAPSALVTYEGSTVDVVVTFGTAKSLAYPVSVAATDPGVFTVGGDGQGDAAALATQTYALISQSAPATMRNTPSHSDVIQLYVTGLGVPDSTYNGTASSGGTGLSGNCMQASDYYANVNSGVTPAPSLTSDDGLVMVSTFFDKVSAGITTVSEPCFVTSTSTPAGTNIPTVTVGGQPATVQWAGWVSGAIAGLYQINVQLPSSTPTLPSDTPAFTYASDSPSDVTMGTGAVHLPVVVTTPANSVASQAGANLWVQQGLYVTVTGGTLTGGTYDNLVYTVNGTAGTALSDGIAIAGADGGTPYVYAVTTGGGSFISTDSGSGDDLTLDAAAGTISGTPSTSGTKTVVFTVTDKNGVTGTVTINFVIAAAS